MMYISLICGVVVFLQCVCQLSIFRWRLRDWELWAHVCLVAGATSIVLRREVPHIEDLIFHAGVAIYFTSHTWRVWRFRCRRCRNVKDLFELLKGRKV